MNRFAPPCYEMRQTVPLLATDLITVFPAINRLDIVPKNHARPKLPRRLSTSVSDDEARDFLAACGRVDLTPPDTLRKLAHAFVEHVGKNERIVLPLRLESNR